LPSLLVAFAHLLSLSLCRRPPTPPLFPYTTLFRSQRTEGAVEELGQVVSGDVLDDVPAGADGAAVGEHGGHPDDEVAQGAVGLLDRKSTRLNSSHVKISYAVFCLKKKNKKKQT